MLRKDDDDSILAKRLDQIFNLKSDVEVETEEELAAEKYGEGFQWYAVVPRLDVEVRIGSLRRIVGDRFTLFYAREKGLRAFICTSASEHSLQGLFEVARAAPLPYSFAAVARARRFRSDPYYLDFYIAEYTERIRRYLEENKVEIKPVSVAEGITVNVLPLQLDERTIAKVADERLKIEVRKTVDEIAKKIEEDIKNRLEELEKKLKNAKSVIHLPNVRIAILEEIENVKQICNAYGVELPEMLGYRIQKFYKELERRAMDSMSSPRARALARKLINSR